MPERFASLDEGKLTLHDDGGLERVSFERDGDLILVTVIRTAPPDAAGRGGGQSRDSFSIHRDLAPALHSWLEEVA